MNERDVYKFSGLHCLFKTFTRENYRNTIAFSIKLSKTGSDFLLRAICLMVQRSNKRETGNEYGFHPKDIRLLSLYYSYIS